MFGIWYILKGAICTLLYLYLTSIWRNSLINEDVVLSGINAKITFSSTFDDATVFEKKKKAQRVVMCIDFISNALFPMKKKRYFNIRC